MERSSVGLNLIGNSEKRGKLSKDSWPFRASNYTFSLNVKTNVCNHSILTLEKYFLNI
jgi:hypothetical protein